MAARFPDDAVIDHPAATTRPVCLIGGCAGAWTVVRSGRESGGPQWARRSSQAHSRMVPRACPVTVRVGSDREAQWSRKQRQLQKWLRTREHQFQSAHSAIAAMAEFETLVERRAAAGPIGRRKSAEVSTSQRQSRSLPKSKEEGLPSGRKFLRLSKLNISTLGVAKISIFKGADTTSAPGQTVRAIFNGPIPASLRVSYGSNRLLSPELQIRTSFSDATVKNRLRGSNPN